MRRWAGMLIAAGLAGCGGAPQPVAPPAPEVRFAVVGQSVAPLTVEATGTVGLRRETPLGFTSPGRIASIAVEDGDSVRPGQLLAALDTTTVAAELASARAERDRAAAELTRSQKLLAQGWITRSRLENAQAALTAAEARVRATGFQRANAVIVAPGAGRILTRSADPGQVVAAGTPVVVLGEEASGYVLRVPLTDRQAQATTIGAPVTVRLAALGGEVLSGQVVEIGGRADRATGVFVAKVLLPGDPRLRAGQVGAATLTTSGTSSSLAVPPAAVFAPRAGEAFVYVLDAASGKVRLRKVAIGDATDGGTRVTGGLRPGERVAVSRIDRLIDGMAVKPIGLPR